MSEAPRNRANSGKVCPSPLLPNRDTSTTISAPKAQANIALRATASPRRPSFQWPSPGQSIDHTAAAWGSMSGAASGSESSRPNEVPQAEHAFASIGLRCSQTGHVQASVPPWTSIAPPDVPRIALGPAVPVGGRRRRTVGLGAGSWAFELRETLPAPLGVRGGAADRTPAFARHAREGSSARDGDRGTGGSADRLAQP